jgi:hypothetical protein
VRFTDAPPIDDDPQAKLLTQVQGMIAEYERAKIAERYRRGKLFRSRAGEVLAWRTPYGYRRHPRDAHGPARLVVFEPEAAIVRRIFDDSAHGGHSLREIMRRLASVKWWGRGHLPSLISPRAGGCSRTRKAVTTDRTTGGLRALLASGVVGVPLPLLPHLPLDIRPIESCVPADGDVGRHQLAGANPRGHGARGNADALGHLAGRQQLATLHMGDATVSA